jgi:YD repeat-containing protein
VKFYCLRLASVVSLALTCWTQVCASDTSAVHLGIAQTATTSIVKTISRGCGSILLNLNIAGESHAHTYDALNRLTRTQWPDGSIASSVYRPDNRKQSHTDQRGITTSYGYDAAGRLTSVSQSLASSPASTVTTTATTAYGYDETAAKTRQTDALGRTTTWSLDAAGRITSRKLQDGSTETTSYDQEGNRLGKTTPSGQQLSYQYDNQNRLTSAVSPAGSASNAGVPSASVQYRYSLSGQLIAHTEQGPTTLAGVQSYRYDAAERLLGTGSPLGVGADAIVTLLPRVH